MTQLTLFGKLLNVVRTAKIAPVPKIRGAKISLRPKPKIEIIAVDIDGITVDIYIYRSCAARNYTVSLARDGMNIRLTVPQRASLKSGLAFVQEKRAMIKSWLQNQAPKLQLAPGAIIPIKGVDHHIIWRADLPRKIKLDGTTLFVGGPIELVSARVMRWLRAMALADLTATTRAIAADFALPVTNIAVNNAVARWGSCSSTGRINYAWRLICAPDAARHYVVAHELAHLKHMNHSPAFWREVTRLGGDLSQRAWFQKQGAAILALR
jgi:predicted metal-dependent hydrolase